MNYSDHGTLTEQECLEAYYAAHPHAREMDTAMDAMFRSLADEYWRIVREAFEEKNERGPR